VWSQWRDRVLNEIQSSDLADIDLPQESMQLSMGFIRNYARFHAVARRWLRDEQQLVSQCHQGCLIPYAIATQQVQALEQTPIDETDIAAMERILT
jgi:hypothetical protein